MKKYLVILTLLAYIAFISLSSYSSGPGADYTGAQGTTGCSCHSGTATPAINVNIELDSAGATISHYVGGGSYTIKIIGTNNSTFILPNFGFELTAVRLTGAGTGSAVNAGTLATTGLPSGCQNVAVGGFHFIEHSTAIAATTGTGSTGTTYVRSIPWTAPVSGSGGVVLYGVINAVNHNGNSAGDFWNNAVSATINEFVPINNINGDSVVCQGSTITLSDVSTGGTYTSGNTAIATVTPGGGVVTGVSGGVTNITYTVGTEFAVKSVTVNMPPTAPVAITGASSVCVGSSISMTDTSAGGVWSATNSHAVVVSGLVTGMTAGIDTIKYSKSNLCGTIFVSKVITVNPIPVIGTITGLPQLCVGSTGVFNDSSTGGTWSSSNNAVATINSTGTVTGVSIGVVTLSYSVTNMCGTYSSYSAPLTVMTLPNTGTVTGPTVVCAGSSITLHDTASGGTWHSSNPFIATDNSLGIITGVHPGVVTVAYTQSNYCGTVSAYSAPITVNPLPNAGVISGSSTGLCTGTIATFSDSITGGVWSMSNTALATVNSSGVVTAIASGTDTLRYTVTNSCGTAIATKVLVIFSTATAGTIVGSNHLCTGQQTTLSDMITGGVYSTVNAAANFMSPGVVSGVFPGTDTVVYTLTTSCGVATATMPVTVYTTPLPISGSTMMLCAGDSITFNDATTGGTWSSGNPTVATVLSTGKVTAVAPGNATIFYTSSSGCSAMASITVNIPAFLPPIGGYNTVCIGSQISMYDSIYGGIWSMSNTHAAISSSGLVTGLSAGLDTVRYTFTNICGTTVATFPITINVGTVSAGTISGMGALCIGSSVTLTDTVSGGNWFSTNMNAYVNTAGVVFGYNAGVDSIGYSIYSSCGSTTSYKVITINPMPYTGFLFGPPAVCVGGTITLSDSVVGGTWSVTNTHATVNTSGVITGVTSGLDTVVYSITNSCGTSSLNYTIGVDNPPYAGPITGSSTLCQGATVTITDSIYSGTMSSGITPILSNSNVTLSPLSGGGGALVTGQYPGLDTLTLNVIDACGSISVSKIFTVNPLPYVSNISGVSAVCIGGTTTLSDSTSGGVWSVANATATVSGTGVVTGVSLGIDTVNYTVTNSCGTIVKKMPVTISNTAIAGLISGSGVGCQNQNIILTESISGGVWSISNARATINSTGDVICITPGIDTVKYLVTTGCGTATAVKIITINASPAPISGTFIICSGTTETLTDTVTGGSWSSSDTSKAMVSSSGVITAHNVGSTLIDYTLSSGCSVTDTLQVRSIVYPSPITGPSFVCVGSTITLFDTVGGGVWSISNGRAGINAMGVVTGMSTGSDTVHYGFTNMCGTSSMSYVIAVGAGSANAGSITGSSTVCAGATITLADTVVGGSWTTSNAIVYVSAAGVVTTFSPGIDTVYYSILSACGNTSAYKVITVNPMTSAGNITGAGSVCVGATTTLSDSVGGGTWTIIGGSYATISSSGVVTGISTGSDTVNYTVTGVCGTGSRSQVIYIDTVPYVGPITGSSTLCVGASVTVNDSIASGGTMSGSITGGPVLSNTNVSLTSLSGGLGGLITGLNAGVDTLTLNITNMCGTNTVTKTFTVNPLPNAGFISGLDTVCTGATITLSESITGGSWSAINTSALVVGGVVTGVSTGIDTIKYSVTTSCGTAIASRYVYIRPLPTAGAIVGVDSVCVGSTVTFSATSGGGTWTIHNGHGAISGGVVTGVSAGIDTIVYTVSNSCGSDSVIQRIIIKPLPHASVISSLDSVCAGASIVLTDSLGGGTWQLTNTHASIFDSLVTGLSQGRDTVLYVVSNFCGTDTVRKTIAIHPLAVAGVVSGTGFVCVGNIITMSDTGASSTGIWSISNTHASVTSGGVVMGTSAGIDTVLYSVTNVCGTVTSVKAVTIDPLPNPGIITGGDSVCIGSTLSLSDIVSGGVWTIANINASITGGVVTGNHVGNDTVTYTVTSVPAGCISKTTFDLRIDTILSPHISGRSFVCMGMLTLILDTINVFPVGGIWTKSNNDLDIFGNILTGVNAGIDTISYTVANSCGNFTTSMTVTVFDAHQCDSLLSAGNTIIATDKILVYPNPNNGQFRIELPVIGEASIVLIDVYGNKIKEQTMRDAKYTDVNLESVARGTYFVNIKYNGIVYTEKIVVL